MKSFRLKWIWISKPFLRGSSLKHRRFQAGSMEQSRMQISSMSLICYDDETSRETFKVICILSGEKKCEMIQYFLGTTWERVCNVMSLNCFFARTLSLPAPLSTTRRFLSLMITCFTYQLLNHVASLCSLGRESPSRIEARCTMPLWCLLLPLDSILTHPVNQLLLWLVAMNETLTHFRLNCSLFMALSVH